MSARRHVFVVILSCYFLKNLPFARSDDGDSCDPNPCHNGGTCTEVVLLEGNSFRCSCVGGSYGKDRFCNLMFGHTKPAENLCASHPCEGGGTCYPDPNRSWSSQGFVCECTEDRRGDRCEAKGDAAP